MEEIIKKFVDELLDSSQMSVSATLDSKGYRDNDLICTFFSYLIGKSILRLAPGYSSENVYYFSKPGKSQMSDEIKRDNIIGEFLKFYGIAPID